MRDARAGQLYRSRVDESITYVSQHLGEPLDLKQVAAASNFSPFHFHRIFSATVGETPQDFVNRLRLERAANLLLKSPLSITEIALACGFSSSATFSRSFKKHFGVTASQYARTKIDTRIPEMGGESVSHSAPWEGSRTANLRPEDFWPLVDIQVRQMPGLHVAYVTNIRGYSLKEICLAWERIIKWAFARDLLTGDSRMIGISFDDPLITPIEKCRYYACITVPAGLAPDPTVGFLDIASGKHVVCHLTCRAEQIQSAYRLLYGYWFPDSGFQPVDSPGYEIYDETPEQNTSNTYVMDICIPVRPL